MEALTHLQHSIQSITIFNQNTANLQNPQYVAIPWSQPLSPRRHRDMADPTYQITYTHYTVQITAKSSASASRLKPKHNTQHISTIPKYNIKVPKHFVSLGLGKIEYQNTIPNPPPGYGAAVPSHSEAVGRTPIHRQRYLSCI